MHNHVLSSTCFSYESFFFFDFRCSSLLLLGIVCMYVSMYVMYVRTVQFTKAGCALARMFLIQNTVISANREEEFVFPGGSC